MILMLTHRLSIKERNSAWMTAHPETIRAQYFVT
jgi:hypothetical protein